MSRTAEYSPKRGTPYSHIAHPISDNFSVLKVWLYFDFGQCLDSKYVKAAVLSQGRYEERILLYRQECFSGK